MKIGKFRLTSSVFIGTLLLAFIVISLVIRVGLPFHKIFSDVGVKFSSIDAYYWARLVDNQVVNFPHLTSFDPFFIFPGGHHVGGALFFVWLQSFVVWLFGLGTHSQHTISAIAVYVPPVMAALTIIPVYFIGKTLFNRWAGVMAAFLICVYPGEFLGRSILGANDTPTSEVLFTTTALAFLVAGIKMAADRGLTFDHILKRDWKVFRRPVVLSLLGGLFLGFYLDSWTGAMMFVFIIILYLVIQGVIDHLRGKSTEYLGIVGVALFLPALVVFVPTSPARELSFGLIVALFIPAALSLLAYFFNRMKLPRLVYPAALVVLAAAVIGLTAVVAYGIFHSLWSQFSFVFFPSGSTATTTMEMQHFLSPSGSFSTAIAWGNFTTSFFLLPNVPVPGFAIIGLVIFIAYFIMRKGEDRTWLLFLIWTLVIVAATLSQRRFAYYLVINIALLAGYVGWQAMWWAGFRRHAREQREAKVREQAVAAAKGPRRSARPERTVPIYLINGVLAIIVVFFAIAFPNVIKSSSVASAAAFVPSDGWQESLLWMKENTPEPLADDSAYYELYTAARAQDFRYPDAAYAVTSWWDYGYWISRIAHRLPSDNPSQAPGPIRKVATMFTDSYNGSTRQLLGELDTGYIMIDNEMPTSKFWAIVNWAGRSQATYAGVYLLACQGQQVPVTLYYPAYYQTTVVRLYNFDGKAVTSVKPIVVTWTVQSDGKGNNYRVITDAQNFDSYAQAEAYLAGQSDSSHMVIVSADPFTSPVTLPAMTDFKEIHVSPQKVGVTSNTTQPEVKVFQYLNH